MIGRAGLELSLENKGETLMVGQGVGTSALEGKEKQVQTLAALITLWPKLSLVDQQTLLRTAMAFAASQ